MMDETRDKTTNLPTDRAEIETAAKLHKLKTWPEYFEAVRCGVKGFEVRKNDRDFQVGDFLSLREYDPRSGRYTGRTLERRISYIMQGGFGLPEDVCMMSLQNLEQASTARLAAELREVNELLAKMRDIRTIDGIWLLLDNRTGKWGAKVDGELWSDGHDSPLEAYAALRGTVEKDER
jgi:hypothetical protein